MGHLHAIYTVIVALENLVLAASFEQGSINVFPSYLQHTVTEVTKGNRWAIVIWIHGSDRFK